MKRILSLIFPVLMLSFCVVQGQSKYFRRAQPKFGYGIKAGINIANQVSPSNNGVFEDKNILGLNAGGFFTYFVHRVLAVQTEISFSGKGSHWKDNFYQDVEKKDILTYVDVPLLIRYQPNNFLNVFVGPQLSYLSRAIQYDYKTKSKTAIEEFYNPFDFAMVIGIEVNLPNKINLNIRYGRALSSAFSNSGGYNYQSYNTYFQFTAGYRIEKKSKLSRSKSNLRNTR